MIEDPSCPVCGQKSWEAIGTQRFALEQAERLSRLAASRLRLLFEAWLPDRNEVTLEYVLCVGCGIVLYRPRPSRDDLAAKYGYLSAHRTVRSEKGRALQIGTISDLRARGLYRYLRSWVPPGGVVLDFGGNSGQLMKGFVEAGHPCKLIDYAGGVIEGVEHLGESLDCLKPQDRFDAIVCSHVLEHLAEPREAVERLAPILSREGILYVEVPLEIWGGPPHPTEPVTHCNFFSPASVARLLEEAGLRVQRSHVDVCTSQWGRPKRVVRALAQPGEPRVRVRRSGSEAREVRRLLDPSLAFRIGEWIRSPRAARLDWSGFAERLRRRRERRREARTPSP